MQGGRVIISKILIILIGICIGACASAIYFYVENEPHSECSKLYPLTKQTLDCAEQNDSSSRLRGLEETYNEFVAQAIANGKAKRISIWVRDLETLRWAAVNEFDSYAPASLFKMPLMITYFSIAEIEPETLTTPIVFQRSPSLNAASQIIKTSTPLVEGQTYTVEELIERMIIDSDNDAAALLLSHIDQGAFENTLVELGLKIPKDNQTLDFVTTKSIASVYRMLYNGSYLSRDYSQKALNLLSKVHFGGMSSPLPKDVIVAHKFGEREVDDQNGASIMRQFHDCGIIYVKNKNPYTLCVMTEGNNFDDLRSLVEGISRVTYENI